jgi:hypothetical protein
MMHALLRGCTNHDELSGRHLKGTRMGFKQKLKAEIKAVGIAALYFGCWIFALMVIKWLVLVEYRIAFHQWSKVLVGALVLSKVVVVLENVPLGVWVRRRPAWVEVVLRTALYTAGVAVVLILEKGLENRHAAGGFVPAVQHLFRQTDIYHVWANTLCVSGALFGFNVLSVIQRHIGEGGLIRMFLDPLPEETAAKELRNASKKG